MIVVIGIIYLLIGGLLKTGFHNNLPFQVIKKHEKLFIFLSEFLIIGGVSLLLAGALFYLK